MVDSNPTTIEMTLIITANQNTKLKIATGQSKDLKPEQIVAIPAGQEMTVLAKRVVDEHHVFCTFATGYGPQNRNSWYLYQPHWSGFTNGILRAIFKPTGELDEYGGAVFILAMEMDGDRVAFKCGSGQPGHQPVPVEQDYPGSMNPLPQGVYVIEKPVYESLAQCDPAIGPVWLALTPQEETSGRGGFIIHPDFNWSYSPGTAGCPFPHRNRDIYTIAEMVDRSTEATLTVDHGF
jgi:hypothetical protein